MLWFFFPAVEFSSPKDWVPWHFFVFIKKKKETALQSVKYATLFSSITKFFFATFDPSIIFLINNSVLWILFLFLKWSGLQLQKCLL